MDESQKAPVPVYDYPPIELLVQGKRASAAGAEAELRENSECLIDTLQSFNIDAQIIHEAAIGRINNEQILKLRTFGLTEEEAEAVIIEDFLA